MDQVTAQKIDELLAVVKQQQTVIEKQQTELKKKSNQHMGQEDMIDLLEVFSVLLKRWLIIVLVTVLFGGAMFAYSYMNYTPKYSSTAMIYVNSSATDKTSTSTSDISVSKSLVTTYSQILNTNLVLEQVISDLQSYGYRDLKISDLKKMISSGSMNNTEIMYIKVTDTDPARAKVIANVVTEDLQNQIGSVITASSAKLVDSASDATLVGNSIMKNTALCAMVGFVLVCMFVIVNDYFLNDIIENSDWLTDNFDGIPILGEVPDINQAQNAGTYGYYTSSKKKNK